MPAQYPKDMTGSTPARAHDNYLPPEDNAYDPEAPQTYDLSVLRFDTPEAVGVSLEIVNRAMLARQITPAQAKAAATVASQSLKALSLSVQAQIKELKERLDARDGEARGPGRRTGIR
jgi:hypothetical protein